MKLLERDMHIIYGRYETSRKGYTHYIDQFVTVTYFTFDVVVKIELTI